MELEWWEERRDAYKIWCEIVKSATPMMEALGRKIDHDLVDLLKGGEYGKTK